MSLALLGPQDVAQRILTLRGERVLLGPDLARLYGVETKVLTQAVQRNWGRFPADFMFQLDHEEWINLRSQIVTSSGGHSLRSQFVTSKRGGHRWRPYAFTEQGVAMLSTVLRSARAIAVNIEIMRAFVRMRRMLAEHADLAARLDRLEKEYDSKFKVVFDAIRQLMFPEPAPHRKRIGFHARHRLQAGKAHT